MGGEGGSWPHDCHVQFWAVVIRTGAFSFDDIGANGTLNGASTVSVLFDSELENERYLLPNLGRLFAETFYRRTYASKMVFQERAVSVSSGKAVTNLIFIFVGPLMLTYAMGEWRTWRTGKCAQKHCCACQFIVYCLSYCQHSIQLGSCSALWRSAKSV